MRYYNQGSSFRVSFSADDADDFAAHWPGSTVKGPGWFEFNNTGDLIDKSGGGDGEGWSVFVDDCKYYGLAYRGKEAR